MGVIDSLVRVMLEQKFHLKLEQKFFLNNLRLNISQEEFTNTNMLLSWSGSFIDPLLLNVTKQPNENLVTGAALCIKHLSFTFKIFLFSIII